MSTIIDRALAGKFVLIAEIGVNYYDIATKLDISLMDAAKLMIKEAKDAGIHAVKFQSYKAGTLAAKASPSYWDTTEEPTTSQYELFQKFDHFGEAEYRELKEFCDMLGIEFLSTAFDLASADYLDSMMDVYKISSSDLNNLPFVEYQARKGKPMLISVGASNEDEITRTLSMVRSVNDQPIALLHCVLEYPTPYEHANLNKITTLKKSYAEDPIYADKNGSPILIGYSDHTKPDACADVIKTAYNLGAVIVEKHFTLDKNLPGPDHKASATPEELKELCQNVRRIEVIAGEGGKKVTESERRNINIARKSIVARKAIRKGEIFTEENLTCKRPGNGVSPMRWYDVLGTKAMRDFGEDELIEI